MRGEIIAIGDELITGRVRESNAGYAACRLWGLGIEIGAMVVVGDDPQAITDALSRALGRADFVLVSGGLGATDDDITAQVAAQVFDLPLAESEGMVGNLRAFFEQRGAQLSQAARRMAQLPLGAEVLGNSSAGFKLVSRQGRPVYFLPGVPQEMRQLIDRRVAPDLAQMAGATRAPVSREVRLFGLGESEVGRRLSGLTKGLDQARLGYYPVFPEVQVLITVRDEDPGQAQELADRLTVEVSRRLEPHVISTDGAKLEEVVGRGLMARGWRLALAESCTGGLIGHRLTQVPGSSDFFERGLVVYSNRAKQELLGVAEETLAAHGAVSAQTAQEMAMGARRASGSEVGLAVTGIAGPSGGSDEKPVGTVYFCLAHPQGEQDLHCQFQGTRSMVKAQSAEAALDLLRRFLG